MTTTDRTGSAADAGTFPVYPGGSAKPERGQRWKWIIFTLALLAVLATTVWQRATAVPEPEPPEVEINDNGMTLSKLRTDAERYTVPEGVTNIVTFSCYDLPTLREITLPEGLKEIGNCAFQDCTELEAITLPTTLAKLGGGAFGRCTALQTAELGDCAVWQLHDTVFARCTALTDVTLPPKIRSIGQRTFYQCRSLRTLTVRMA